MILELPNNPSVQDFIIAKIAYEETQKIYKPIQILKNMKYPTSIKKDTVGAYGLIKSILP